MSQKTTATEMVLYKKGVVRSGESSISIFATAMLRLNDERGERFEPRALLSVTEPDQPARREWVLIGGTVDFRGTTWTARRIQSQEQGGPLVVLSPSL